MSNQPISEALHHNSKANSRTWKQADVQSEFASCRNLAEVIICIEAEFLKSGDLICEIHVNGMVLAEADEARFADCSLPEIQDISVVGRKPADLIGQALFSVSVFMSDLQKSSLSTSDLIRDRGLGASAKPFSDIIDGCQWAVETLIHARNAASGIARPIGAAERWLEAEKTLNESVRELTAAYMAKDSALVADILEYEIPVAADIWIDAITTELKAHPKP